MTETPMHPEARFVVQRKNGQLVAYLRNGNEEKWIGLSGPGNQAEIDFIWLVRSAASFHNLLVVGHRSVLDGHPGLRRELNIQL